MLTLSLPSRSPHQRLCRVPRDSARRTFACSCRGRFRIAPRLRAAQRGRRAPGQDPSHLHARHGSSDRDRRMRGSHAKVRDSGVPPVHHRDTRCTTSASRRIAPFPREPREGPQGEVATPPARVLIELQPKRVRVRQLARTRTQRLFEGTHRARLIKPDVLVELPRQVRVEIVALELRLRMVHDTNRSLE